MFDYYKEYKVNTLLAPYIDCVWIENYTQRPGVKGKFIHIVPDNTIELIFTESKMTRQLLDKKEPEFLRSHLSGLKTRPQKIVVDGRVILAVRFKPTALRFFTNINLCTTIDAALDTVSVFGKSILNLEERIFNARSLPEKIRIVEYYFIDKIYNLDKKHDRLFDFVMKQIQANNGNIKITSLSEKTGYSLKTLERNFITNVGITPVKYSKLLRFINTVNLITGIEKERSPEWSSIAYRCGYYDQNHFIKAMKRYTGLTPQKYFNTNRSMQLPVFSKSQEMSISSYP